jgi:pimeloyl-ACP methyl ester carboxylesterase
VHGWGLGRNYGPRPSVEQAMLATVDRLHATRGRRVSLIGQSLGGAYARLLAMQRPDAVRCVITLGSPIGGHPHASNARRIYEFTSGESADDPRRWRHITQAPPVPATAIYSRSDGIVAWQDSVEPSNAAHAESIRVLSSHVGMAVHRRRSVESRCGAVAVGLCIAVAAPFGRRCPMSQTMAPFPHPAHRTGRADLPHPALGRDFTPSPTTRRTSGWPGARARSARRGAGVDSSRPCAS